MVTCDLLIEISARYPGEEVTLVMDNASYQRNTLVMEVAEHFGIELLFLPPYSPNLNLIERLWKLVKKRCLLNRYDKDFDSFTNAIDSCLDSVHTTLRDDVRSLLSLNFQFFSKLPLNPTFASRRERAQVSEAQRIADAYGGSDRFSMASALPSPSGI